MFVIIFFIIAYICFFFIMILGFCLLLNKQKIDDPEFNSPSISIIVSVRNEYDRITPLLKSFESQKNISNKIELTFIDDHSTDDTFNKLKSWTLSSQLNAKVITLENEKKGKKNAITHGVSISKSDYILSLDADIYFNSDFLQIICSYITNYKDFYIIPVVENDSGNVFSIIESFMLSLVTMGSAKLKFPLLANGAAMLFKKSSFNDLQPFVNNQHISSGDDIFLLQSFKMNDKYFEAISPKDAVVFTESPKKYKHYVSRALRWSGKMKFSSLYLTKLVGLLVLLTNYLALGLLIILLFHPSLLLLFMVLGKFFIDFIGLLFMVNIYGNISLLVYSPLMMLFYPFHLLILLIMSFFNLKKSWKGRLLIEK